jgi:hypothetical protein
MMRMENRRKKRAEVAAGEPGAETRESGDCQPRAARPRAIFFLVRARGGGDEGVPLPSRELDAQGCEAEFEEWEAEVEVEGRDEFEVEVEGGDEVEAEVERGDGVEEWEAEVEVEVAGGDEVDA